MNKKTRSVLLLVLVFLFCLTCFAGCRTQSVGIFDYTEKELGVMGRLVMAMHKWLKQGNYGWAVVLFTVALKVLMLPLDLWQRYSARKSALKMQKMQPLLAEIDRRFGANTQRANEEKQKVYKKQGYSMMSQCLPMIVSMVVFFVMFAGLRNYSTYNTVNNFNALASTYYQAYASELVKEPTSDLAQKYTTAYEKSVALCNTRREQGTVNYTDEQIALISRNAGINAVIGEYREQCLVASENAKGAVKEKYLDIKESWLWIQSVWQPDTWDGIMPKFDSGTNNFSTTVDMSNYPLDAKSTYNTIRDAVLETTQDDGGRRWNGLLVLPLLSVGLSFLSMFISQRLEHKNRNGAPSATDSQQATTNKTMMIIMPLMMAYFGFLYTGAFAIYMVVNYALSILSTIALRAPVERMVEKNLAKMENAENSNKASYMR